MRRPAKPAKSAEPAELAAKAIENIGLSPDITELLGEIQSTIANAYRDRFIEMVGALRQQASALERIQTTLNILAEVVAPQMAGQLPTPIKVSTDGQQPDIASALVVSDPIGAGYTMSQADLARVLKINVSHVSVLVRAFKLKQDGECAVVIRQGSRGDMVNYHRRAVPRFLHLVHNPPTELDRAQRTALQKVQEHLSRQSGG